MSCVTYIWQIDVILYMFSFLQSGSQNDLCDTFTPEEEEAELALVMTGNASSKTGEVTSYPVGRTSRQQGACATGHNNMASAEYPFFQMNFCGQSQGNNFDLNRKRGEICI